MSAKVTVIVGASFQSSQCHSSHTVLPSANWVLELLDDGEQLMDIINKSNCSV